jgi:hypothetical protein
MLCIDLISHLFYISGRINISSKETNNYLSIETKHVCTMRFFFLKARKSCSLCIANMQPEYDCTRMITITSQVAIGPVHLYDTSAQLSTSLKRNIFDHILLANQNLQFGGKHCNSRMTSLKQIKHIAATRRDFSTNRQMPIAASSN